MSKPSSGKNFFVSDLHHFSKRSQQDRYDEPLHAVLPEAETLYMGGDIFDFRWSKLESLDASVDAANDWLIALMERYPNCKFHYLLGNHDSCTTFVRSLERLDEQHENFAWHPYFMRVGRSLFLHGDVVDGVPVQAHLERRRETDQNYR